MCERGGWCVPDVWSAVRFRIYVCNPKTFSRFGTTTLEIRHTTSHPPGRRNAARSRSQTSDASGLAPSAHGHTRRVLAARVHRTALSCASTMDHVSCERFVPTPDDAVPGRTPQALHSTLLSHAANRSVVVIGDTSTDLVACLSHVARKATIATLAINAGDCAHLKSRAARGRASGHVFEVACGGTLGEDGSVAEPPPDADLFVFSQAAWRLAQWKIWARRGVTQSACREAIGNCDGSSRLNHVDSYDLLFALRRHQLSGRVRATAQVALFLDENTDHDAWTYATLHRRGYAAHARRTRAIPRVSHLGCQPPAVRPWGLAWLPAP